MQEELLNLKTKLEHRVLVLLIYEHLNCFNHLHYFQSNNNKL